jgi:hypothetical protein
LFSIGSNQRFSKAVQDIDWSSYIFWLDPNLPKISRPDFDGEGDRVCGSAKRRPTNNCRNHELVGRDSVEQEVRGRSDDSNQPTLPEIIALRLPEPRMLSGEEPHNRGLTLKGACVPERMLAGSLACSRDDSKKPNPQQVFAALRLT